MKICLVNPPTTDPYERFPYFPMALITLGGIAKSLGVETELWDFDLYFKKIKNETERKFKRLIERGVKGVGTDIFGISSICSNLPMALWIAREIKRINPTSIIILGGPQPSSVPMEILENFSFIDLVVIGEGEKTLETLILKEFKKEQWKSIPGIAGRDKNQIWKNEKRPLMTDLDSTPFPDYSLVDINDYISLETGTFYMSVEVGRGCPFHCTFCSTSLMWEKNYRVKSPERIYSEVKYLMDRYPIQHFSFIHDNFTTSRKFVSEFCEFLETHDHPYFTWDCSSRTDCIDISRLERMVACGLKGMFFGLETGSNRMQEIIKKNLKFETFEPLLKRAIELRVRCTTAFIIGFPEEKPEDINQTFRRALKYAQMGLHKVQICKLSPLTGTSIYNQWVNHIENTSSPSDTCPLIYDLPYVHEVIKKFPKLFSSFYQVPHPYFSKDQITRLCEFGILLVTWHPEMGDLLINKMGISATTLFQQWDIWAQGKNVRYWDNRSYRLENFIFDFQSFLDEVIFQECLPYPSKTLSNFNTKKQTQPSSQLDGVLPV